ncbi:MULTISPECIES: hypothetical protein [unclassified Nocardiopsis]|uniref:hypothetical protein n=1 Tax=unclassified Nocardiopsis TaxID=2649073 RepID=UPI0013593016|nr:MULTISPECIES: hypothetical protein [unclassified Nocardiopsis]
MTVRVRFAWWLCGMFLALGAGLCGLGVWLWATAGSDPGLSALIPGLIVLAFGAAYVRMPYFVLAPGRLTVPIMRGSRAETALDPRARLDASGTRLTMTVGRRTTASLPVYRSMARRADWDRLRALLDDQDHSDAR